jgi:TonB family protein
MRRWAAIAVLACSWALVLAPSFSLGQQEPPEEKRKIVSRWVPDYPRLARDMNITGIVKAEAVVASNGTVKSVEVKGGHPLLVRAAQDAISRWKWEAAAHETREPIVINFNPR